PNGVQIAPRNLCAAFQERGSVALAGRVRLAIRRSSTDTPRVARLLRGYAQRSALRGGNPYRAKAHATGSSAHLELLAFHCHTTASDGRDPGSDGGSNAEARLVLSRRGSLAVRSLCRRPVRRRDCAPAP